MAGVAALIRQAHPGLAPGAVAALIRSSATDRACPDTWPTTDPRTCTGGLGHTSFFGSGLLDAQNAVAR